MEKPKKRETILETMFKVFLVLLVVSINSLILMAFFSQKNRSHCSFYPPGSEAKSVRQSLESSVAIYVAQQRTKPETFSDFVVADGEATGGTTLSLAKVQGCLLKPQKSIQGNEFTLHFRDNTKATYYLDGTDVTVTYEGF